MAGQFLPLVSGRFRASHLLRKRPEAAGPTWHVAMRPGKRRLLNAFIEPDFVAERVENMKASIRAKVEHLFRMLKCPFGFTKVRYRGVKKTRRRSSSCLLFRICGLRHGS